MTVAFANAKLSTSDKKVKTFLTMEQMHGVANAYDVLRKENKTERISDKSWRDQIHLSEEQLEELGQLNKGQNMQEKINEERKRREERELWIKMRDEDPERNKSKEEEYAKLVNSEYLKSLDAEWEKTLLNNNER